MTSLIAKRCLQAATLFFTAPDCVDLDGWGSTAPTVLSKSPLGGDTDVPLNESVRVTFDLALHPATLIAAIHVDPTGAIDGRAGKTTQANYKRATLDKEKPHENP